VGNLGKASRRAKPDVRKALELHRELNPNGGSPLIVGLDQATGQLFFLSRRGSCRARDRARSDSVARMVYEAWPQLRPSA